MTYTANSHAGRLDSRLNSTDYVHPQETNLLNIHRAMQYNADGQPVVRTHVDGITLAANEVLVSSVTIESGNVTVFQGTDPWIIEGNVNVTSNVTVSSITSNVNVNPITGNVEVTGNVTIDGNVTVVQGTNPWNITGNANVTGNVVVDSITSNVNVNPITGNVNATVTSGNVNVNVTSNVTVSSITSNVNIGTMPNINATVTSGNISVTQGTDPWVVTGVVTGNITTTPSLAVGNFYGEPYAISLHPLIQFNGHDGIRPNDTQTYTALSGSTTVVDGVYNIACSTTAGSYGVFRSRRFAVHRAGQSNVMRFLAKFDTAAANTQQMIGAQNLESAFYIGYNGTQFGLQHTYSGRAAIYSLKINSYTGNQTVTLTLNGTVYTISIATGETVNKAAQRIAAGISDGVWFANQVDDTVHILSSTVGDKTGTFSVTGSGNLNATLTRQVQGVASSTAWFYNGVDFTLPPDINLAHYNEWQIKYDWVGVTFFVLNVSTNQFELFHRHIHNSLLEVKSASFKIAAVCYNTGGSNAVTLKVASMMAALEGEEVFNGFPHSTSNTQETLAADKYWHLITLQNPFVFDNKINTRQTRLLNLTVAAESGDPVQIMLVMDAALSTAIYNFTSQDSFMVSFDNTTEAEVNMTNNWPVLTMACPKTGGQIYELRDYNLVVPPGARLSVVAFGTASISRITTAINWINK